jgi:hypothetical protein
VDIAAGIPQIPFPLQKPYTKCMSTYSSFVNVLGILTMTTLQYNTVTLTSTVNKHKLSQVTPVPACSTSI